MLTFIDVILQPYNKSKSSKQMFIAPLFQRGIVRVYRRPKDLYGSSTTVLFETGSLSI